MTAFQATDPIHDVVITRMFDAPRSLVWRAWTEPEHVMRWWGPKDFISPTCTIDLRVGGSYLFCMQAPDGQKYWSTGVYREIVPLERIVCTDCFSDQHGNVVSAAEYGMDPDIPLELLLTLEFAELGSQTRLTISYANLPPGEMAEMTKHGMEQSLDKLAYNLT